MLDSGDWVFDFDGGGGNDAISLKGTRKDSAIYKPSDLTQGAGDIKTYFENGDIPSDDITFENFEPVDISGMSTVTIASPANATNSLTLNSGFDFATGTIPAIVVTGNTDLGMTGIEEAHLWNDTNVIIDTSATTAPARTRLRSAARSERPRPSRILIWILMPTARSCSMRTWPRAAR